MRSRILIVARDVALRARLARLMKDAGHGVELAENAEHASRIGLDGVAVALVAPHGLEAEAKSLAAALDARAIKTFLLSSPEDETALPARVAEALRPAAVAEAPEPVLRFGGFRLDVAGHSLTDEAGKDVPLTRGEFHLLRAFVQRPGRVLSRDQLLQVLAGRDAEFVRPQHRHAGGAAAPEDRARPEAAEPDRYDARQWLQICCQGDGRGDGAPIAEADRDSTDQRRSQVRPPLPNDASLRSCTVRLQARPSRGHSAIRKICNDCSQIFTNTAKPWSLRRAGPSTGC